MKRTATALLLLWVATACTDDILGLDRQALIQDSIGPNELQFHVITAATAGALLLELSWNNRTIDLDLIVTGADCPSDPLTDCTVLAQSRNILTTREVTGLSVAPAEQYKAWIENNDPTRTVDYGLDYEISN